MATPAPAKKTAAPRKTTSPVSSTGAVPTGSSKINALVKALDDVELTDQHTLNAFCEALRLLCTKLAVETALGSGQLTAGAKAMAKGSGKVFLLGLDTKMKIRKVTKALESVSDHLGSAAADAVTAWATFETEFEDLLTTAKTKADSPKTFHINQN